MLEKTGSKTITLDLNIFRKVQKLLRAGDYELKGFDEDLRHAIEVVDWISDSMASARKNDNMPVDHDMRPGVVSCRQPSISSGEGTNARTRTKANYWELQYDTATGENQGYSHDLAYETVHRHYRNESEVQARYLVDPGGNLHYIHRADWRTDGPSSKPSSGSRKTEIIIDGRKGTVVIQIEEKSRHVPLTARS